MPNVLRIHRRKPLLRHLKGDSDETKLFRHFVWCGFKLLDLAVAGDRDAFVVGLKEKQTQ